MARKRASMREGPLAELFKATEAAQRQTEESEGAPKQGAESHGPRRRSCTGPSFGEQPAQRHLEPVESVVEAPPAPAPTPSESPALERLKPEIWDVAPEPPILHSVPRPDSGAYVAVIKVVGVGGAGLNAVNRMIDAGLSQVEFIAVNTDSSNCSSRTRRSRSTSAGSSPRALARVPNRPSGAGRPRRRYDEIKHALRGADMVFVDRGRGRRHRLRRGAGRGEDRPRARRAHGRHRHDAVQVRGHSAPGARPTTAYRRFAGVRHA